MKPFAVFEGITDEDGKFSKFDIPGKHRHRFRVVMWIKAKDGTKLENDFSTKQACRFTDFMAQIVRPAVDEIMTEAAQHGGTKQYGFSCYKWG